jgi:Na+/H+-dicarboxylate symporter
MTDEVHDVKIGFEPMAVAATTATEKATIAVTIQTVNAQVIGINRESSEMDVVLRQISQMSDGMYD